MAPSEDVFNLPSTSGPNQKLWLQAVPSGPASESPFLLDLSKAGICGHIEDMPVTLLLEELRSDLGIFVTLLPLAHSSFFCAHMVSCSSGLALLFSTTFTPAHACLFIFPFVYHLPVIPLDLNSFLFKFKLAHLVLGYKQFLVN